jgi:hypothetical protein
MLDPLEAAFAGILFILLLVVYFSVVSLRFLCRLVRFYIIHHRHFILKHLSLYMATKSTTTLVKEWGSSAANKRAAKNLRKGGIKARAKRSDAGKKRK